MILPEIVYLQTITACNGHCSYCPFDDIYGGKDPKKMSYDCFLEVLKWLEGHNYCGRIGFLLHCEPTLDERLELMVDKIREVLPRVSIEIATNGILKSPVLKKFDIVDCVPAGSLKKATSRAGNCRATSLTSQRIKLKEPCNVPLQTMCVSANGDILLCCQDWRHEAVVGTYADLTAARKYQLSLMKKVINQELEICRDCMAGKTAEDVGDRLGKRFI